MKYQRKTVSLRLPKVKLNLDNMGKRKKAAKPVGPKKRDKLETTFQCLFCNHDNAVSVEMRKKEGIAHLSCKICGQNFQAPINNLSEPVDVMAEWVDACEAVKTQDAGSTVRSMPAMGNRGIDISSRKQPIPAAAVQKEDDLDGFIDNDEPDMEETYADDDD